MGLFDRFRSTAAAPTSRTAPWATINEIRKLARSNPQRAIKQLRRAGQSSYEAFGVEGAYHDRYLELFGELTERRNPPPSLAIALWSRWQTPTNGKVIDHARRIREDVLYLVAPRKQQRKSAAAEAEALCTLASDDTCPLIMLGEADLMVRKNFLLDVEALVDREAEEVCQDLIDAAAVRRLRCGSVMV